MAKVEGYLEQKGTPTPDFPIPINTGIIAIVNGKKKIIPFDNNFVFKEGDYTTKKEDGKWYLVKGGNI